MFQLLITVNLKSSVGAGVSISQTVVPFKSERLADTAYNILMARINRDVFTTRLVEKLYKPTQK